MRVRAFAKINLSLRVLGVRADGYHELRTVFQSLALHDTLTFRAGRGPFRLTCDDPTCPPDRHEPDLARGRRCVEGGRPPRRARAMSSVDSTSGFRWQAGLGGGSSDAAAALRALGRLWRVDARERARRSRPTLGADVPYFFEGGTVLGLERGDLLFPLIDYAGRLGRACAPGVRRQHEGGVRVVGQRSRGRWGRRPVGR